MSLLDFAIQAGSVELEEAGRATILAEAVIQQGSGVLSDIGIFGVGLTRTSPLGPLQITLLTSKDSSGTPPGPTDASLRSAPSELGAVRGFLGGIEPSWLGAVQLLRVPLLELEASPGDVISKPHVGTVGCNVTWGGKSGFLTAGHVAPSAPASVRGRGGILGNVIYSINPKGHGTTVEHDTALVELAGAPLIKPFLSTAKVGPGTPVSIMRGTAPGGVTAAQIMGYFAWLYLPSPVDGTVGESYSTTAHVTVPGDSGSPVSDPSTGAIIGHVLGASVGYATYIQAIDFQLNELHRAGYTGITI